MGKHFSNPVLVLGIGAVVLLALYRRYRSNIGPQRVKPIRMSYRVLVFAGFAIWLIASPHLAPDLRMETAAGLAFGCGLGLFSLGHTHFEMRGSYRYYTPNIYIGLGVSALFVIRLAYRFVQLYPQIQAGGNDLQALSSMPRSGVTLAMLGLVMGYYVLYYAGVLYLSRQRAAVQPPVPGTAAEMAAAADQTV